jgi:hypothetical protein
MSQSLTHFRQHSGRSGYGCDGGDVARRRASDRPDSRQRTPAIDDLFAAAVDRQTTQLSDFYETKQMNRDRLKRIRAEKLADRLLRSAERFALRSGGTEGVVAVNNPITNVAVLFADGRSTPPPAALWDCLEFVEAQEMKFNVHPRSAEEEARLERERLAAEQERVRQQEQAELARKQQEQQRKQQNAIVAQEQWSQVLSTKRKYDAGGPAVTSSSTAITTTTAAATTSSAPSLTMLADHQQQPQQQQDLYLMKSWGDEVKHRHSTLTMPPMAKRRFGRSILYVCGSVLRVEHNFALGLASFIGKSLNLPVVVLYCASSDGVAAMDDTLRATLREFNNDLTTQLGFALTIVFSRSLVRMCGVACSNQCVFCRSVIFLLQIVYGILENIKRIVALYFDDRCTCNHCRRSARRQTSI